MAPRIDYLRFGQHQLNKRDMPKIVRHLIDEIDTAASMMLSLLNKLLTEFTGLIADRSAKIAG